MLVPAINTLAPGKVSLLLFTTLPLTVPVCADTFVTKNKSNTNRLHENNLTGDIVCFGKMRESRGGGLANVYCLIMELLLTAPIPKFYNYLVTTICFIENFEATI
jgi:hypothetical protein